MPSSNAANKILRLAASRNVKRAIINMLIPVQLSDLQATKS